MDTLVWILAVTQLQTVALGDLRGQNVITALENWPGHLVNSESFRRSVRKS